MLSVEARLSRGVAASSWVQYLVAHLGISHWLEYICIKKQRGGRNLAKRCLLVRHRIENDICMTRRHSEGQDRGMGSETFHKLLSRRTAPDKNDRIKLILEIYRTGPHIIFCCPLLEAPDFELLAHQ